MKKIMRKRVLKALVCAALGASVCAACSGLCGCFKTTDAVGEMNYVQWGTNYGIKVNVQVQTDKKGKRIREVTVLKSDYVSASPANEENGWDPVVWDENLQTLLNAYRGMYVDDVLALEVVTNSYGAPLVKSDAGFENYGDDLIITGATLGSGRLLIAVQNALKTLE